MMRYDYKVINTNARFLMIKRTILYVTLFLSVITTALVVLFILFELYLRLILCAALYAVSFVASFTIGKIPFEYRYSFTDDTLTVTCKNGKNAIFLLKNITIVKNAEKSDFLLKDIIKLTFIDSNIDIKNAINKNNIDRFDCVAEIENQRYLLTLDGYSLTIIKGANNEHDILG